MKREIKFRMWSTDANKFWYDPENVYGCLKNSKMPEHKGLYDDMVWQQYTGLVDKNGVEIYEGDIIKGEWYDEEYKHSSITVSEVVYNNAAFNISWSSWHKPSLEVFGNVFEHRELLK